MLSHTLVMRNIDFFWIEVMKRYLLLILVTTLSAGCSSVEPVAAWERGYLAKDAMQWDAFPREGRFAGHVYTSKEASSGGSKAAGGGCGCN